MVWCVGGTEHDTEEMLNCWNMQSVIESIQVSHTMTIYIYIYISNHYQKKKEQSKKKESKLKQKHRYKEEIGAIWNKD